MVGADTAWIIVATALVLFMTLPGLALFFRGTCSVTQRAERLHALFHHRVLDERAVARVGLFHRFR